jgi:hypothetical protein
MKIPTQRTILILGSGMTIKIERCTGQRGRRDGMVGSMTGRSVQISLNAIAKLGFAETSYFSGTISYAR